MKKLIFSIIGAIFLLLVYTVSVCGDTVVVYVNGNAVKLSSPAVHYSEKVYIAAEDLFRIIGIPAEKNSTGNFTTEKDSSEKFYFNAEEETAEYQGTSVSLDDPLFSIKDKMYVSLDDFKELFGYKISLEDGSVSLIGDFTAENFSFEGIHYDREAIYSEGKIYGEEVVEYVNYKKESQRSLFFLLPAAALDPQSEIRIHNVTVDGQPVEYEAKETYLKVNLQQGLKTFDSCTVNISFDTHIPFGNSQLGRNTSAVALSCWYPVVPLSKSVPVYSSFGEPYSFLAATYNLEFTVPSNYEVVTGIQAAEKVNKGDRVKYVFLSEKPVRDLTLVLGNFDNLKSEVNGVTINYFHTKRTGLQASHVLEYAGEALELFERKWGEYPYRNLNLVDVPLEDLYGMEYSRLLFFSSLNPPGRMTIAHEVAHQWWYGLVGNDQQKEAWIDEGLANYGAALYLEEVYGYSAYFEHIKKLKKQSSGREIPEEEYLWRYASKEDYRKNAYIDSTLFWHNVREKIGKEKMNEFLAGIQEQYRYREIKAEKMRMLLEKRFPAKFNFSN